MKDQSVIAQSCPICLAVDDPEGMLLVAIERTTPPDAVAMRFCYRCARAIAFAVVEADLGKAPEVVNDDSPDAEPADRGFDGFVPGDVGDRVLPAESETGAGDPESGDRLAPDASKPRPTQPD